ncbi:hypothetical protein FHT40_001911 [Mycolicibacterium sp. BK556]|uniref:hypothetical protein n=1 Tax=unclassified Mycolicibacterium TaxID=2636767 RepID=UPI001614B631|nr:MULTISPECIES: hypothetical protein [unclassified Mycolicibacterium]MBB3602278.1 hypothetical protein [Mycolicibacterium sp. BK556]MBB3632030.1 hypothetical protein [Mycolicibacterium sp. BK607]
MGDVPVNYGGESPLLVDLFIDAYAPRSNRAMFVAEPTDRGPELPGDQAIGLHYVGNRFVKAKRTQGTLRPPRHAFRGELDITLSFEAERDNRAPSGFDRPPDALVDALRETAHSVMALLNIHLGEYLAPVTFQIRKMMGGDRWKLTAVHPFIDAERAVLTKELLSKPLLEIGIFLIDPVKGEKYRTALELYAAHFGESQPRVRFLLLVIAMEALAVTTPKDQVAQDLIDRWLVELRDEAAKYPATSSEGRTLESLAGQVRRLKDKSIGAQVGDLFGELGGTDDEVADLKARAKAVYNKRSTLVHDGYLPAAELENLEKEARSLVETLFRAALGDVTVPDRLNMKIALQGGIFRMIPRSE